MIGTGVALLLCASAACAAESAAESQAFTAEDLLRLDRISDLQVSPDGRYAAFTVRQTELAANTDRKSIWLLDLEARNATPYRLTDGADSVSPRWAPDSRTIYFLSPRSGDSQVWRVPVGGGGAEQITRLPIGIEALKVSPKGDRLLASIAVYPDCPDLACSAARLKKSGKGTGSGRLFDRLFVRHWDRWEDGRQSHLFSLPLRADGAGPAVDLSRQLDADVPSKPRGGDEEFSFSPDGTRVAFTARIKGRTEPWSTNFDIYEVASDGSSAPKNLTAGNPAWDTQPVYSSDGRWLAWKAMDRPQHEADRFHLMLLDRRGGAVRAVAGQWDRSIARFAFSADNRSILATTDHLGQHPLWRVGLDDGRPTLVHSDGQVTEFAVGPRAIVFGLALLDQPVDLYRIGAGATRPQRLTRFNHALLAARRMSGFEQFSFAGWNGERVYGYLMRPFGFTPGRTYPLVMIVHGGPQLSYGNGWSYRWNPQVYAGAGYAVLFIDFHGSTGYGQGFSDSINNDWGGKPLEDLQKGLAAALARYSWLDGKRACAIGSSYSGYLMNWIESAWSGAFRCLVNHAGAFNRRGMYYETDEMWLNEWEFGGPEYEQTANYRKHDPIEHVALWRTPMFVGHGELDFNVPFSQGISTFTALQRRGIESRLLIFPDEGHFILKPQNSLQWHHEVLAWLDRWLKPEAENRIAAPAEARHHELPGRSPDPTD